MPELESINEDAVRILSKVEKDFNDEPIGKVGDETVRFNDESSARKAAIKMFYEKFATGWVLESEDGQNLAET